MSVMRPQRGPGDTAAPGVRHPSDPPHRLSPQWRQITFDQAAVIAQRVQVRWPSPLLTRPFGGRIVIDWEPDEDLSWVTGQQGNAISCSFVFLGEPPTSTDVDTVDDASGPLVGDDQLRSLVAAWLLSLTAAHRAQPPPRPGSAGRHAAPTTAWAPGGTPGQC